MGPFPCRQNHTYMYLRLCISSFKKKSMATLCSLILTVTHIYYIYGMKFWQVLYLAKWLKADKNLILSKVVIESKAMM